MISLFIDTSLVNVSISVIKDGEILSLIEKSIPRYIKRFFIYNIGVNAYFSFVYDNYNEFRNNINQF